MDIKQISVFLENKPGALNEMTQVLADKGINLRALSLAETTDFGIARFIVDDVLETMNILKEAGFIASLTPVVAAEVADEPGSLNRLLSIFSQADINLEYMYAFIGAKTGKAYMIIRVPNTMTATGALVANGIRTIGQEDLAEL